MSDLINNNFEKISKAKDLSKVAKELDYVYNECSKEIFQNSKNKFYTYIPPKTLDDLKDCYSDGWLKVLLKRNYYDSSKSIDAKNWIGTVIFNSISNCMQRHNSIIRIDKNDDGAMLDKYLITSEDSKLEMDIYRFIDIELNDEQKQIFIKRFIQDIKVTDVAKQLNKSVGYISEKYNDILRNLKVFLKK